MLVGIHQQYQGKADLHTPYETLETYPRTTFTREFTPNVLDPQNLIPKWESACRRVVTAGMTPVWSFKPEPGAVLRGLWDPYLQQLADHLNQNMIPNYVCIWHEPENDLGKYFKSARDFTMVFNRVHNQLKAVSPSVQTVHAALGYRYRDGGEISDAEATQWRTQADVHCIDLYSGRSFPLSMTMPENSAFKRWHSNLVNGRRWGVTERGWTLGPDAPVNGQAQAEAERERADCIRREADWLATTDCQMYIAWDSLGTEGDPGLMIRDTVGVTALQGLMDKVTKQPEPDPEPTPMDTTDCPLCNGSGRVKTGQTITIVRT